MKKAVLWMIAGIMILGSLKTFASDDVTAGKLDAVAQDSLDSDIQADITEGKIQAAELQMALTEIKKQIAEVDALQESLDGVEQSFGLIHGLGMESEQAKIDLARADSELSLAKANELKTHLASLIKEARSKVKWVLEHEAK
jgi:hypothetical protein